MKQVHRLKADTLNDPTDIPRMLTKFLAAGILVSDPNGNIRTMSGRGPYRLTKIPPEQLIVEFRGKDYRVHWSEMKCPQSQQVHELMETLKKMVCDGFPTPKWMKLHDPLIN